MPLIRVKHKAQITLPARVRKQLNIREGDYLDVSAEGQRVVLKPQQVLDWVPEVELSAEGQGMLEEALEDVRAGRFRDYPDMETFLSELRDEDSEK